jgi:hypothetical protein
MNPFDDIPLTLIPSGRQSYTISAGPTWLLAKSQGRGATVREEERIVIESERHGTLEIVRDPEDPRRVVATIPSLGSRPGELSVDTACLSLTFNTGERVTLELKADRIDVALKGFGLVADRLRIFFVPIQEVPSP